MLNCTVKKLRVLNLIINGLPSKQLNKKEIEMKNFKVLNLIINGLPSKLKTNLEVINIAASVEF